MLKAAKKLKKLWTKRNKTSSHLPPTSTSTPTSSSLCCCSCNYRAPVQPSAPPLPPWLEPKQSCGTVFAESAESAYPTQEEVVVDVETNSNVYPSLQSSYQQYTVPDPVYGVPLVQAGRRERSAGVYGCIISFGDRIIRCFCPCLQIRQVREIVL